MLASALEFKDVFPRYQQRDSDYQYLPSEEDWIHVQEVCSFLELFNELTKIISGSEYPTSNLFLPELWQVKEILDQQILIGSSFTKAMTIKMKTKFDKYWGQCNLVISIAAILDPRNKIKLIEFAFPIIYEHEVSANQIVLVKNSLYELYNEYVTAHEEKKSNKNLNGDSNGDGFDPTSNANNEKGKAIMTGRSKFDNFIRNIDTVQHAKSELDIYLDDDIYICQNDETHFDALEWWKTNNLKYRILSKMACDILSIPITTVASESTFSAGGRVIDNYHASLGVETVQVLLCGEDWFRHLYG
ncbi:hypothetical protein ZIOFF_022928 [Zingiber officinale]|uniref:Zinc finger BED domain-containing protein RICESLEEPER 2-like n=1 Tax=Zingiber officinale TaxID=94328 RepID=A0A8J5HA58_ZINOF|nr:hypothetical protein ZIOFF_022928 [Zingiber officinale]